MLPRTLIAITIQIYHDDGGVRAAVDLVLVTGFKLNDVVCLGQTMAASVNAALLALMDAGVPMTKTLSAVTVMLDLECQIQVNPSKVELKVGGPFADGADECGLAERFLVYRLQVHFTRSSLGIPKR
jgi:hypothetical protein